MTGSGTGSSGEVRMFPFDVMEELRFFSNVRIICNLTHNTDPMACDGHA